MEHNFLSSFHHGEIESLRNKRYVLYFKLNMLTKNFSMNQIEDKDHKVSRSIKTYNIYFKYSQLYLYVLNIYDP